MNKGGIDLILRKIITFLDRNDVICFSTSGSNEPHFFTSITSWYIGDF